MRIFEVLSRVSVECELGCVAGCSVGTKVGSRTDQSLDRRSDHWLALCVGSVLGSSDVMCEWSSTIDNNVGFKDGQRVGSADGTNVGTESAAMLEHRSAQ